MLWSFWAFKTAPRGTPPGLASSDDHQGFGGESLRQGLLTPRGHVDDFPRDPLKHLVKRTSVSRINIFRFYETNLRKVIGFVGYVFFWYTYKNGHKNKTLTRSIEHKAEFQPHIVAPPKKTVMSRELQFYRGEKITPVKPMYLRPYIGS